MRGTKTHGQKRSETPRRLKVKADKGLRGEGETEWNQKKHRMCLTRKITYEVNICVFTINYVTI